MPMTNGMDQHQHESKSKSHEKIQHRLLGNRPQDVQKVKGHEHDHIGQRQSQCDLEIWKTRITNQINSRAMTLVDMVKFWKDGGHFNTQHYAKVLEAKIKQLNSQENEAKQDNSQGIAIG